MLINQGCLLVVDGHSSNFLCVPVSVSTSEEKWLRVCANAILGQRGSLHNSHQLPGVPGTVTNEDPNLVKIEAQRPKYYLFSDSLAFFEMYKIC